MDQCRDLGKSLEQDSNRPGASDHRGLLLVDGHASRINPKLWQTSKNNDADVLTFVSHASHVLQPLDLCVFGAFKSRLRGGMTGLKALTLSQKRAAVMTRAFDSLYHALSPINIKMGFEKAGIWPLDRDMPLGHSAVNHDPTIPAIPVRKRKTVIALDGDTLTSQEALKRLMNEVATPSSRTTPAKKKSRKISKSKTKSTPYDESDNDLSYSLSEEE